MNAKTAPLDDRPLRTEPIRPTGDAGDGWGRAAAYDAYADGLHTYAIWLLRDHDAAVDALYCTYVLADRHVTQLRQPEYIQPWLYAIMRRECALRTSSGSSLSEASLGVEASASVASAADGNGSVRSSLGLSLSPVSGRLRPPGGPADPGGSLASLERNLRRAEFHSLEWPESEGLAPAHREILELTIRHGLDSHGLGLVLGLGQSGRSARGSFVGGAIGSVGSQGFGVLADAWRELERSLAAVAVAKASREHCAQLAELTFGWSGRLTATLRAPLTDHVDGCTRCQHYLHTVIGTPAAPTILPFVAAPRALREILLGELHDPQVALRLGIDHEVIAARIQRFAANGFPAVVEAAPVRRRGGRRAAPKRGAVGAVGAAGAVGANGGKRREGSATLPVVTAPTTSQRAADTALQRAADTALPRRTPGASMRRADERVRMSQDEDPDAGGVYRAPGSWAARVLPADTAMTWRPNDGRGKDNSNTDNNGSFISTPSGRFASRVPSPSAAEDVDQEAVNGKPASGEAVSGSVVSGKGVGTTGDAAPMSRTTMSAAPTARMPRLSSTRRRPRPVRRAVLSAVTLGAVGATAAATAALLGAASDGHSPRLADLAPPQDPINTMGPGEDGLSVSVSTPAATGTSSGARASNSPSVGGSGASQGAGSTGVTGTVRDTAGTGTDGGLLPGQGVNAADFKVSVNQRDADPHSVTILLRNIGSAPIAWSAVTHDSWIVLSQRSGTLAGGQSQAIVATVTSAAPSGAWTSTVTFAPGGAVVTLRGVSGPTSGPSSPPTSAPPSTPPATGSPVSSSTGQPSTSASPGPTGTPSASSSPSGGVGPSTAGTSRSAVASGSAAGTPSPSASVRSSVPTPGRSS